MMCPLLSPASWSPPGACLAPGCTGVGAHAPGSAAAVTSSMPQCVYMYRLLAAGLHEDHLPAELHRGQGCAAALGMAEPGHAASHRPGSRGNPRAAGVHRPSSGSSSCFCGEPPRRRSAPPIQRQQQLFLRGTPAPPECTVHPAAAAVVSARSPATPVRTPSPPPPTHSLPSPLTDNWGIISTPRGLRMYAWSRWGNLRYAANAAFVSLLYAKQLPLGPVRVLRPSLAA